MRTATAVLALHTTATAHCGQLAATAVLSYRKLARGTLLEACGWELMSAGRIKPPGEGRDVYAYGAQRLELPEAGGSPGPRLARQLAACSVLLEPLPPFDQAAAHPLRLPRKTYKTSSD